MRKIALRLSGLALLLGAQGAAAYDYNCDLRNTGSATAYDIAVVLDKSETVTATFNGYPSPSSPLYGHFYNVTHTATASGDTVIHWMNMNNNDSPIVPGKTIHVGWSTADCHSTVKDMYWTDKNHRRIRGSVVNNLSWGITYRDSRWPVLDLGNIFQAKAAITLFNLRFAVLPQALPLEALSSDNRELLEVLRPLSDAPITVNPGERRSIPIPANVEPGQAVVAFYEIAGDDAAPNAARIGNFVQQVNINNGPCSVTATNPQPAPW
ncbi:hypothetical protein [Pyxidicoccus trucidator]|uniref:hypothetical protein n=1 Tax=Pyxidicoccus trucidator TaxID=2709662 RepID=UPI0013DD768E|nr:hypothetical protein [Pyxidicoccus trucidator]